MQGDTATTTAVWEALYGNPAAARQKVTTALALGRGHEVDYAAAFALAVAIFVAVEGLIVWSVLRYRRRPEDVSAVPLLPVPLLPYSRSAPSPRCTPRRRPEPSLGEVLAQRARARHDTPLALNHAGMVFNV